MGIHTIRCRGGGAKPSLRRAAGFTIIELMLAATVAGMIFSLMAQFLITSSRGALNLCASVGIQLGSQYGMDLLTQDVKGADLCLSSYTNGSTTYTANTSTTLILRTPSINTGGTMLTSGSEDHIIYQLVATAAGASNGPYTLNRTVVPASGSGRMAASSQIVVTNVTSVSFTYIAAQTQTQNALGTLRIFALLNGAAYAAPVGSVAVQQAVVAGVDQCAGSSSCYSGTTLTLSSPVTANAPMDLRFSVDPTATVSTSILSGCGFTCASGESANFAKEVAVTLQTTAIAGNSNSLSASAPTMTLSTIAALRNKAAF